MKNQVVDKQTAELEFERFAEEMDLDLECYSDEDRASLEVNKGRIVRAIMAGALVIDEKGQPVFTPARSKNPEPITFYEPTGATYMASDGTKKGHEILRANKLLADMTRTHAATFAKLANSDYKVCQSLLALFLG